MAYKATYILHESSAVICGTSFGPTIIPLGQLLQRGWTGSEPSEACLKIPEDGLSTPMARCHLVAYGASCVLHAIYCYPLH